MVGAIFIKRTGSDEFVEGMIEGQGFSIVAEKLDDEKIDMGVEADFFRTRTNAAGNDILDGTQGIGGLVFVASVGQIKNFKKI